jgi:hypothetical protein
MATTSQRTLQDRMDGAIRFARALGNDPTEWELDDLIRLELLEGTIRQVRDHAIHGLRGTGHTDKQIGEALGITQQAVSKRWPGGGRYVGAAGRYRTGQPLTPSEDAC